MSRAIEQISKIYNRFFTKSYKDNEDNKDMKKEEKEEELKGTEEEINALKNYVKGGHHLDFNKRLRDNKPLTEQQIEQYKNLYNIIDKNRITEDMTVYRGIMSSETDFKKSLKSLGMNRAFTSTSKSKGFSAGKFRGGKEYCCKLIIHLKKGDRAIDLSESYNRGEGEVLIAPGNFHVINRYVKNVVGQRSRYDFSGPVMKETIEEVIEPTTFYELSYENNDEKLYSFRKSRKVKKSGKKSRKVRKSRKLRKSGKKSRKVKKSRKSVKKSLKSKKIVYII